MIHNNEMREFLQVIADGELDEPVAQCGVLLRQAKTLGLVRQGEKDERAVVLTSVGREMVLQ